MSRADQRLQLIIRHKKKCCFCGRRVFLYTDRCENYVADDLATVEHLFSKLDIRRFLKNPVILSCWRCNNNRSKEEQKTVFTGYFGSGDYVSKEIPEYRNTLILMLLNKQLEAKKLST